MSDPKNVTLNLIVGDKTTDDWMHKADMFESFKRYGDFISIEYEIQSEKTTQQFIDAMKKVFEEEGFVVTAIWDAKHPENHYVDWTVKCTSNGHKWTMLEDYLKQFGIIRPEDLG